jgi:hypothetical protein
MWLGGPWRLLLLCLTNLTVYYLPSGPEDRHIYVDANTRIQILDTMAMLPQAEREQCAAFIVSGVYSALFTLFGLAFGLSCSLRVFPSASSIGCEEPT